jgi:hypothetical protein
MDLADASAFERFTLVAAHLRWQDKGVNPPSFNLGQITQVASNHTLPLGSDVA